MKNVVLTSIAMAGLFLSGCASITSSEEQSINVTSSNGKPLDVTVDDKTTSTPGVVVVLRDGKDKVITTSTEGCDSSTPIEKSVTPIFWGNIIIGGVFGSTTDSATGKMWDYEDSVEINCTE